MNISIITCTYNPDEKIFHRVLEAVKGLTIPSDCKAEYIIIDNNSSPPLKEKEYIKYFLKDIKWSKVIVETNQGLSHARLRGLNESIGDIIIFFDDDNVADVNYLMQIKQLFESNVQVGIWGPGNIEVVFTDPVPKWVEMETRGIFQEKNIKTLEFGYSLNGASFHPFGTGMALRREIMEFYNNQFNSNKFTASGRKGNSLSSSDDIQLVYSAFKMGWATGVSPCVKMKHLIPAKRTTLLYICRLLYGSYVTGDTALLECFPELKDQASLPLKSRVIKDIVKKVVSRQAIFHKTRFRMDMAVYIGKTMGRFKALNVDEPKWISNIVNKLKFES